MCRRSPGQADSAEQLAVYAVAVETSGKMSFILRRNMNTHGSDSPQDLVAGATAAMAPVGKFFNVVYVYDSTGR